MPCANCGAERTIRAHLIPQAFVREVRGDAKGYALTNRDISSFQPSQNGRYDDGILCAACDNHLGADEKYALEKLAAIRGLAPHIVGRPFMVDGIDGDRLFRFAAGVVWKFALTKPHYGRIAIGPYADVLRALLYDGSDGGQAVNGFLMKLYTGDHDAYFNRAPSTERYHGVNFVRFSVGSFIFLLKLDRRPATGVPAEAWLRGSNSVLISAMAFNQVEEGCSFINGRRKNARLDAYLERVSTDTTTH